MAFAPFVIKSLCSKSAFRISLWVNGRLVRSFKQSATGKSQIVLPCRCKGYGHAVVCFKPTSCSAPIPRCAEARDLSNLACVQSSDFQSYLCLFPTFFLPSTLLVISVSLSSSSIFERCCFLQSLFEKINSHARFRTQNSVTVTIHVLFFETRLRGIRYSQAAMDEPAGLHPHAKAEAIGLRVRSAPHRRPRDPSCTPGVTQT